MKLLRFFAGALLAFAAPAHSQDIITTSTAPAPTQVRLPLIRAVPDGDRVVFQVVGSTTAPLASIDGRYIGVNGYTTDLAQAQNMRGPMGTVGVAGQAVEGPAGPPGAPGKSTYVLWLEQGNTGTVSDFLASLKGAQGGPGVAGTAGADSTVPGPAGRAPTAEEISAATSAYISANATLFRGDKGDKGDRGERGADGGQGPAGPAGQSITGPMGPAGSAATITIGPVTTGQPGTAASCTNIGTLTAAILSCSFPRGYDGANGTNGANGAPGATGATGPAGAAGQAATVAVGTVTTLAAGATPTVTNAGTTSAAVLNFGLPRSAVYLNDITLAQTAVVSIALGPRTLTVSTNCQVGDRLVMTPSAAMPAGYMLGDIFCSAAGTAQATLYAPLLAIGASYTISAKVMAFR